MRLPSHCEGNLRASSFSFSHPSIDIYLCEWLVYLSSLLTKESNPTTSVIMVATVTVSMCHCAVFIAEK